MLTKIQAANENKKPRDYSFRFDNDPQGRYPVIAAIGLYSKTPPKWVALLNDEQWGRAVVLKEITRKRRSNLKK